MGWVEIHQQYTLNKKWSLRPLWNLDNMCFSSFLHQSQTEQNLPPLITITFKYVCVCILVIEDYTFQLMNPGVFCVTLDADETIPCLLTFQPTEVHDQLFFRARSLICLGLYIFPFVPVWQLNGSTSISTQNTRSFGHTFVEIWVKVHTFHYSNMDNGKWPCLFCSLTVSYMVCIIQTILRDRDPL